MKSRVAHFLMLAAALVLAACSPVSITTDYDKSVPFPKFKTYTLAPAAKGQSLSPSSEAALRNTLRAEMAKRGWTEKTSGKPDIAIARHVFLQDKISVHEYTDWGYYGRAGCWPYGYGYYSTWPGAPRTYVDVSQYTQGTLILDFIDTRTNKLVFRGTGTSLVGKPEANAERVRAAVTGIVAGLPQ